MKLCTKAVWSLAVAFCCTAARRARSAGAQTVTTGNITGVVTDAQGGVLPGATVTAIHTATGTSYEAVTGADGPLQHPERARRRVHDQGRDERVQGAEAGEDRGQARATRRAATSSCSSRRSPKRSTWSATLAADRPSRAGTADNISQRRSRTAADDLAQPLRHRAHLAALQPDRRCNDDPLVGLGRRPQQPLQQHADRRRGQQRRVRPGGRRARPAGRPTRSRSASTRSRRSSSSSRRTTSGRAASPAAASTRSPRAARNRLQRHRLLLRRATRISVGEGTRPAPKIGAVQGQAGRLQRRRPDRAEQGVLLRQRRLRPQGQRRPASRSTARGADSAARRKIDRFIDILQNRYGYDPGGTDEFSRPNNSDKYLRPRRLQRVAEAPADVPPQLHRRAERHRPAAPSTSYLLPDASIAISERQELEGLAVEQHDRRAASTSCA